MLAQYEGIFIDFACLPQKDALGQRTDNEDVTFKQGLKAMGFLYSSAKSTTVLQLKTIPTPPADYTGEYGTRSYDSSGWCVFEEGAAQLVAGTEAVIRHELDLLREPFVLFKAYVWPLLAILFSMMAGESYGSARRTRRTKQELDDEALIASINEFSRPKLLDVSDVERPRNVKLYAVLA